MRLDRLSTALTRYEECRRALRTRLDVERAETTAVYERICSEEVGAATTERRRSNFPFALWPLIGRERELPAVLERSLDPGC